MSDNKKPRIKGNDKFKELLIYYVYKHKANWFKIQKAIEDVEPVEEELTEDIFESLEMDDFISINELTYPNNFKVVPLPPLCTFIWGDKTLLLNPSNITSLWGDFDVNDMVNLELPLDKIYAVIGSNNNIDRIKKILKRGYKLILVANQDHDFLIINELIKDYRGQVLFISEVPANMLDAQLSDMQTNERLLFTVGNDQLSLDNQIESFKNVLFFIPQTPEKTIITADINRFTAEEVTIYNLTQYKKRVN